MVSEAHHQECQVLVIGAGPGGYLAAIRLAQLKKDVILLEKNRTLGGVCLNEGCIPSKALIHAADFLGEAAHAIRMGIHFGQISVDMKSLHQWKNQIIKKLTDGVKFLVEKNGARIVHGEGKLLSRREVEVLHEDRPLVIEFEKAVIATGASSTELHDFPYDEEKIIDSRTALSLDTLPRKLVVIGAGYIGLELGIMYRKLGTEVAFVDSRPAILPFLDQEVGELLTRRLQELGTTLFLGCSAEAFQSGDPSSLILRDNEGNRKIVETEKVLVCVGRRPNTKGIGLERAGVEVDERGFIQVNSHMETNIPGIYAIGDVAREPLLADKAYREAKIAAEVIAGEPSTFDHALVPSVIYADPEIAWAGVVGKEAQEQGSALSTGTFPFRASGRALTLNAPAGFVKTFADAKTGRLKGVIMVGHGVSELISEAALALEMGAFLKDLHATIHPHPTLSEALLESVDAALGQAIHIVNIKKP
jgi:dihydrolipoamide dehydrogenase